MAFMARLRIAAGEALLALQKAPAYLTVVRSGICETAAA
jgi:hypothetical protein